MGSFTHEELRSQAAERYAPLFEPLPIGPKVAPNRFYSVAYTSGFGMRQLNEEIGHRKTRAEGGWGVVTTGRTAVAPETVDDIIDGLTLLSDEDTAALAQVADAIHAHGALAAIELGHKGVLANAASTRLPPLAVSPLDGNAAGQRMTTDDVRYVQAQWVAAARRARNAGFDIVEVHCAHNSLALQFLTPFYNQRSDEYGGSLENRSRFLLELLTGAREAIGADTAIACRYSIAGLGVTGLEIDEALAVMRMADHLVDLWDIAIGGSSNFHRDLTPSRLYPEGASLEWSRRARAATSKPVVACGRFTDPELMLRVICSGELDFVGAARPGIADPFLPRKIAAGELSDVRACIGSNRCAYSQFGGPITCSQNATAGEEYRRGWRPEHFEAAANRDLPVLVVGAGPAGLECATVLARRDFELVHLVDAAPDMGGHLRWFTRLPRFGAWDSVIGHRRSLVERHGHIRFVPDTKLDAEAVLGYGTAIVVVATGARWATTGADFVDGTPIPGADATLDHVLTPEQILLDGKPVPGRRVVVYDSDADTTGLSVALHLLEQGHAVELVSPLSDIGMRAQADGVAPALRAAVLNAGGRLRPTLFLKSVTAAGAVFADEAVTDVEIACDALVLVTTRRSETTLYDDLVAMPDRCASAGISALYRIGDCVSPQNLSEAIFSGHRLAREIDAPDPSRPLAVARP